MKFIVVRTSYRDEEGKKPCKNCFQEEIIKKNGYKGNKWVIEINSLEELMEFQKDIGEEIIISRYEEGNYIEIYDDYRE